MQTTLERPPAAAPPHRFDVDDYYRMAEAGILSAKDRVELIEGEVVDMAPIGSGHAATTDVLAGQLTRASPDELVHVRVQGPLRLDPHNEPQPDLMLLRPRRDRYREGHPTAADVLLLVEISDSSLAYDSGPKLALYARHGVPEVWVVDIVGRTVEVCLEPGPQGYARRRQGAAGTVSPTLVSDLVIDLETLWGG